MLALSMRRIVVSVCRVVLALALATSLIHPGAAAAAQNVWTSIGPEGGDITKEGWGQIFTFYFWPFPNYN